MLRSEEVGKMASISSQIKSVRRKLVDLQRRLAETTDVIMDGRDIGTCVLPDADVKIYLTASSRVRAQRRFDELQEKGIACNFDEIEKDIIERDRRDMTREESPLKKAEDAIEVDTSDMSIEQVIATIIRICEEKRRNRVEVILAKSRGFCFGVKRAVDTVYGQIGKTGKLYTYGDIVNNEEVVGDLKMKGVSVINDMEELKQAEKGTVIIRAHGVGKAVYEAIEKKALP